MASIGFDIVSLRGLIGDRLLNVERWLFSAEINHEEPDELTDGPVRLSFHRSAPFLIVPNTACRSVNVISGCDASFGESYFYKEVGSNPFWSQVLGLPIQDLVLLRADGTDSDRLSGLEIVFAGALSASICFADTGDFWDSLIVTNEPERFLKNIHRRSLLAL